MPERLAATFALTVAAVLATAPAAFAQSSDKALFEDRCASCHTVKLSEPESMGPALGGVVGRKIASVPRWGYSPALKSLKGAWTEARLNAFLADPEKVAPGSGMAYQEPKATDRAAIIRYLKTLKP